MTDREPTYSEARDVNDNTGRTVQVDLTLRVHEQDAQRLLETLHDTKHWFPQLISFLTPWRDKRVFPFKVEGYQFGQPEDAEPAVVGEDPKHEPLTEAIKAILRDRGYDDYPDDEDLFEELLDDIDKEIRSRD